MAASGHIPELCSAVVMSAAGIRAIVSGRAIRLVSRKLAGRLLKYIYATGAVVIWQAIDSAEASQIRFIMFIRDLKLAGLPSSEGQKSRSLG